MKKRLIALVVCLVMLTTTLFGCTPANGGTDEPRTGTNTVENNAGDKEEPVTISFITNATAASMIEMYEKIIANYTAEHKNVTIDFQTNAGDYSAILATKINADELPDIFHTNGYKESDIYSDYCYDIRDDAELNAMFERVFDNAQVQSFDSNGKVVGLPNAMGGMGIIYNKAMFEQAGIDKLPETYDELKAVCEKFESMGITPFTNGYKEWWVFKHIFSSCVGVSFSDYKEMQKQLTDGTKTFSDLEYMDELFQLLDLTLEYSNGKSIESDAAIATAAFANGESAMLTGFGEWVYSTCMDVDPELEMGIFPEPIGNNKELNKMMVDSSGMFCIAKDTKNFEATKDFLLYMYEEIAKNYTDTIYVPVGGIPDREISNVITAAQIEASESGKARTFSYNYWPVGFEEDFGGLLQEYIIGTLSRDDVLKEMQNSWNKLSQ